MKEKNKINGWKLTAILSLIVNGLVALLLTIGLASPRSYVKASADFEYSYDSSKIITNTNSIRLDTDYYLYFDWDSKSVPNNTLRYEFPNSNNVPTFKVFFYDTRIELLDSRYCLLGFSKNTSTGDINFYVNTYLYSNYLSTVTVARISYGNNPITYIEFLPSNFPNYFPTDFVSRYKALFDGSININRSVSDSDTVPYDLTFLKSYFSQYSVQNIQLTFKTGGYELIRSIDFQSSYSFVNTMHNNYNFINNNLIRSTGRLFNTNYNYDYGYMFSLDGKVAVDGVIYEGLSFVWKPINLLDYYFVSFDNFAVDASVANQNNTFYYYLDSLCPYGSDVFTHVYEWVRSDEPIAYFYTSTVNSEVTLGETKNRLLMSSNIVLTNKNCIIKSLNMYPYVLTYESWTYNLNSQPSLNWGTISYLFKPINHFYFNSGSPVITDPVSNDISNSTDNITGVFALITSAFEALTPMLSIMVLPNISLGLLLFVPLILTIIYVVVKLVKR